MMDKKILPNIITIKTEPNTSTNKKNLPTSSPFVHSATKSVSSTRLASFIAPRDLYLTGSTASHSNSPFTLNSNTPKGTRRTFMPNINVTRKKGSSETTTNDSPNDSSQKNKDKEKNRKPAVNKRRSANIIQTQGVFSEGLAPGKVKAFTSAYSERAYNERQVMDKPKLNLNKKISKSEEDSKLKSILKDDFVDDPSHVPDINFLPNSLPIVYNVKKPENPEDLEKTFENLQVKAEKVSSVDVDELKNDKSDFASVFEGGKDPKLFLFEFPSFLQQKDEPTEKKKVAKGQTTETEKQADKTESLSSLGEGFLGYLRIHENGKAYLVVGKNIIPLCLTRHGTRQELMSASVDAERSKGEVVSLGTIDASFTCSTNFFQDVS